MIQLEERQGLPEGAEVEVRVLSAPPPTGEEDAPSLYQRLKDIVGQAEGLPPDLSVNLDHYLYGLPKQP